MCSILKLFSCASTNTRQRNATRRPALLCTVLYTVLCILVYILFESLSCTPPPFYCARLVFYYTQIHTYSTECTTKPPCTTQHYTTLFYSTLHYDIRLLFKSYHNVQSDTRQSQITYAALCLCSYYTTRLNLCTIIAMFYY